MCFTEDEIIKLIKESIEDNLILLYFQPIYNVEKNGFTCAEVLSRILDKKGEIISPSIFIPVAESNGLICGFGYSILEKTCRFINKTLCEINFSINISPIQLLECDFADKVINIINKYGISPSQITLEITESVEYELTECIINNINKLAKFGVSFSLDDMGKGSSDLFKVSILPLNAIKIDKMYIENIESNISLQILIKNIILYANSKNMYVVAEGVETIGQKIMLESLKCHYLQGYYFSKPLPESFFIQLLCQRKIKLKFPVKSKI